MVASYHCMQFQGKIIMQTQENGKKPHFGPNLGPLGQIWADNFFSRIWLHQSLDITVGYYHVPVVHGFVLYQ